MTLLIRDEDAQQLLPMAACIEAMEFAFADYANGRAVNRPRVRYTSPTSNREFDYFANIIVGAVPRYDAAVVRIGSHRLWANTGPGGSQPRQHHDRHWGNFLLYSLETGEPLAIVSDFTIGPIRVGATTALAVKYLAREHAATVGVLGTGKQARTNLEGICLVRSIRTAKVFSPNAAHRIDFAAAMHSQLEIDVVPVDSAKEAVSEVDIVCCATNGVTPVFEGSWLEPGQLVTSIVTADAVRFKTEVDEATYRRSDLICINDKESVIDQKQRLVLDAIERGVFTWDKVHELGELVAGKAQGRQGASDLIFYHNNTGMGIQFAAAGAVVYQQALKLGVGHEIPTEWFGADLTDWYAKGYQ